MMERKTNLSPIFHCIFFFFENGIVCIYLSDLEIVSGTLGMYSALGMKFLD